MALSTLLLPVFIQVGLTFGLGVWMAATRLAALRGRKVHPKDVSLRQAAWPDKAMQIANSYQNQLEAPILFYVLVSLVAKTVGADVFIITLSWLFVLTRFVHAYVHTGSNHLLWRFIWFGAGASILFLMWAYFAFRTLAGT